MDGSGAERVMHGTGVAGANANAAAHTPCR